MKWKCPNCMAVNDEYHKKCDCGLIVTDENQRQHAIDPDDLEDAIANATRAKQMSDSISPDMAESGGFAIYRKGSSGGTGQGDIQAVKNGFSWPAALFGAFWAWSKGMVGIGFGLLALGIILRIVGVLIDEMTRYNPIMGLILDLSISIGALYWIGTSGNTWRKSSLEKKGFVLVQANAPGSSPSDAILQFERGYGSNS